MTKPQKIIGLAIDAGGVPHVASALFIHKENP
jgi:hypothetical protein